MLKKSLSQHLIKDRNILARMTSLANIGKDDIVVEIGPGRGDFTGFLAEKAGHVYAIELDRTLAEHLDPLAERYENLDIIYGDFLEVPLEPFKNRGPIKVAGNIPYKITAPILFKLISERKGIVSAHLTMQKEIGQRVTAGPFNRTYGALSVICQLLAEVKIVLTIKAGAFVPPPKVDSIFLSMIFNERGDGVSEDMLRFVHTCFEHKRKRLSYAFRGRWSKERIDEVYGALGLSESARAEEIEPERFVEMYEMLGRSSE